MPNEVSVVGPCTRKIRITVPKETVAKELESFWRQAQRSVSVKGFRPGKVPRQMIERMYGDAIRADAKQHIINHAYGDAIREHDLHPLESPRVDSAAIELDPAKEIEFEVTVDVRPDFAVPEYKGVEVGAPVVAVGPDDVERQLEGLRTRHATLEPIGEGVVKKGDLIVADVSYRVDGAIVIHHEDKLVDTGNDVIDGIDAAGATASFFGQRVGNTVSVTVKLPPDFEPSGFAGAAAELLCTVKQIRRVTLPELGDEFAKKIGAESLDALREHVKHEVEHQLQRQRERYIEERVLDELIRRSTFDLPDRLLERATQEAVAGMQAHLVRAGMPEGEARAKAASESERVRQDQARSLRVTFLVDSIARQEQIVVSERELENAVRALATAHNVSAQEAFDQLDESGRLGSLRAEILEAKVRKILRDHAKVFEAKADPA